MTNKDSARWLRDMLQNFDLPMEQYQIALNNGIKELEQEPVLDKIRAEVEELDGKYVIGDYAIYGENTPKYVRLWDVLLIIDKYKVESEEEHETDN